MKKLVNLEGEGGLTTLTKDETAKLLTNMATAPVTALTDGSLALQNISGKYYSKAIVQVLQINLKEFNKLNPNFDKQLSASRIERKQAGQIIQY